MPKGIEQAADHLIGRQAVGADRGICIAEVKRTAFGVEAFDGLAGADDHPAGVHVVQPALQVLRVLQVRKALQENSPVHFLAQSILQATFLLRVVITRSVLKATKVAKGYASGTADLPSINPMNLSYFEMIIQLPLKIYLIQGF